MLSERIYELRKKNALSQEQLAERVGVSRQTVSKWENAAATPELDKLRALAECFGVTLDELAGEGAPGEERGGHCRGEDADAKRARLGLALCLLGAAGLAVVGGVLLLAPERAAALEAASAVTLSGSGIALALCAAVMALGLWLALKRR